MHFNVLGTWRIHLHRKPLGLAFQEGLKGKQLYPALRYWRLYYRVFFLAALSSS